MCKNAETEATKQEELFFNLIQLSLITTRIPAPPSWRKGTQKLLPPPLNARFSAAERSMLTPVAGKVGLIGPICGARQREAVFDERTTFCVGAANLFHFA